MEDKYEQERKKEIHEEMEIKVKEMEETRAVVENK